MAHDAQLSVSDVQYRPTETWNLLVLNDRNGKIFVMATSSMPLSPPIDHKQEKIKARA